MKGLLVGISDIEKSEMASETAILAAVAWLCLAVCPRVKGVLAAFGCLVIDQALQWRRMDGACMTKPIHMWLLGAFTLAMICYISCANVAARCKTTNVIPSGSKSKGPLVFANVMPVFLFVWSGLGIFWLDEVLGSDTPCTQKHGHPSTAFLVACPILLGLEAFVCLVMSAQAWVICQSVERGSAVMMAISDAELVQRWGVPKAVLQEDLSRGLSPAELDTLPCGEGLATGESCVICLCSIASTERVRKLPNCSHCFHRCCVDQWLLRNASCPTCKAPVTPAVVEK